MYPSKDDPLWGNRSSHCESAGGVVTREGSAAKWECTHLSMVELRRRMGTLILPSSVQVWLRNLSNGDVALAIYNNGDGGGSATNFSVAFTEIPGLATHSRKIASCQSLWGGQPAAKEWGLAGAAAPWQCLLY